MGLSLPGSGTGAVTASSLTISTVGSISFWLRPQSVSGTQRLCGTADNFEARFSGTTLISDFGISGSSSLQFGTLSIGTLYHMVGTWNVGTTLGQVYRDGAFISSASDRNGVSNGVMAFGDRAGGLNPLNGELYDIRIYNRVLSAAEILTLYTSRGRDGIVDGMIHRWMMDEAAPGTSLSGTGTLKDQGSSQINASVGTGTAPTFIYTAPLQPRKRVA